MSVNARARVCVCVCVCVCVSTDFVEGLKSEINARAFRLIFELRIVYLVRAFGEWTATSRITLYKANFRIT